MIRLPLWMEKLFKGFVKSVDEEQEANQKLLTAPREPSITVDDVTSKHSASIEKVFDKLVSTERGIVQLCDKKKVDCNVRDAIISRLDDVMFNFGATPIDDDERIFDIVRHIPSDGIETPDGTPIVEVLTPGVVINKRILRRAVVRVSRKEV